MVYKDLYKARGISKLADSLAKRSQNVAASRQEKQREFFWSRRGQNDVSTPIKSKVHEKKKNERAEMLAKWKAEKLRALEEAKKKKKPAFKVGVVQRTATGSPLIVENKKKKLHTTESNHSKSQISICERKTHGVLTRSKTKANTDLTEIQLKSQKNPIKQRPITKTNIKLKNTFCEINMGTVKQLDSYEFKLPKSVSELPYSGKLTYPISPNLTKKSRQSVKSEISNEGDIIKERDFKQTEKDIKDKFFEMQIAEKQPKKGVKKEHSGKIESLELTAPEKDECRQSLNNSSSKKAKKPKRSLSSNNSEQTNEDNEFESKISSFRNYVETETKRLLDMCDKWKCIYEEFNEVPSDVEGEIDSIIGKTKLLTSDKFMQFKDLIDKCESKDPLIKLNDLQGFQDWIAIEVEKMDEDFDKLEKRKKNNWIAETTKSEIPKSKKIKSNKNASKKTEAKSNIRSHINAVRKLLKQETIAASPESSCLLRNVLNSETKKKNNFFSTPSKQNIEDEETTVFDKVKTTPNKKTQKARSELFSIFNETQYPDEDRLKKTPHQQKSLKNQVNFKQQTENIGSRGKGLNEKYFNPPVDDDCSLKRFILGDLDFNTPSKITTRSKTHIQGNI